MNAADFFAGAGKERIERFRNMSKRALGDPTSEEAIHDLRVSIRRLLAWIDVREGLLGEDPELREAGRSLKKLMSPLGRLRDAHVKREWIRKLVPFGDEPSYRYAVLVAAEVLRRERAVRRLLRDRWAPRIRIPFPGRRPPRGNGEGVVEEATRWLAGSAREVARHRKDSLDPGNPTSLHRMRLAFKKYRYACEVFSPLFPNGDKTAAKRHQAFQTLLGTIHDCDVVLAEARSWMKGLPGYRGGSSIEAAFGKLRREKFREFRKIAGTAAGLSRVFGTEFRKGRPAGDDSSG